MQQLTIQVSMLRQAVGGRAGAEASASTLANAGLWMLCISCRHVRLLP